MYVIAHKNFAFHTKDDRCILQGGLMHVHKSAAPQLVPDDIRDTFGFKMAQKDGAIAVVEAPVVDAEAGDQDATDAAAAGKKKGGKGKKGKAADAAPDAGDQSDAEAGDQDATE